MPSVIIHTSGVLSGYGTFKMNADNAAAALRGICLQIPDFKKKLAQSNWTVLRNGRPSGLNDMELCSNNCIELYLVPSVSGGKSGAGKIITGAALVAASILIPPAGATGWIAMAAQAGLSIGVGMMLTGTSQILSGTPKSNYEKSSSSEKTAKNFDGPVNSSGQGLPLPMTCGRRVLAGSVVASAVITTVDE